LAQPLAKVLSTAEEAAKKAGDSFVTFERLLQALAIESSSSTFSTLKNAGVTAQVLNQVINDIRNGRTADSSMDRPALTRRRPMIEIDPLKRQ
ncbi:Clp protease N-terminal domain-containing protein, partial [Rhizobium ruizarguesonis]